MHVLIKQIAHSVRNGRIIATDLFDRRPREKIAHEKFGHLLVLHPSPLRRSDSVPIKRVERFDFRVERRMISPRVATADGPRPSRCETILHCAHQMKNAILASGRMAGISLINGEEHGRPRTKIKRNEIAYVMIAAAWDVNFIQPTLFDFGVTNQRQITRRHHRVRIQTAIF